MGRPGLNHRQLLATAGGLAVAGSFGFAALGTGADALASGARTRVRYWNLLSGGQDRLAYQHYDAEDNGTPKPGLNRLVRSKDGRPTLE